jgi:thiamine pyrophosphate-dependent acetolactate synthase large subunit-like protein
MDADRIKNYPLRRRAVVKELLAQRGDTLVVAGLGTPAWDVTAAGDEPLNFPLWGAMGGAVPLGLGLALAQPSRRVLVITGDGEMLMGLSSYWTTNATGRPVCS